MVVSNSFTDETKQPRVRAYDLGDNMLSSSDSAVLVSVLVNPTSSTLRPTDRVFEVSDEVVSRRSIALAPLFFRGNQAHTASYRRRVGSRELDFDLRLPTRGKTKTSPSVTNTMNFLIPGGRWSVCCCMAIDEPFIFALRTRLL